MDRPFVYPGAIPLETDLLNTNRNVLVAFGRALWDILGSTTLVGGLACTQTTAPSMAVAIGAGAIYAQAPIDATAYSSLPADVTDTIIKQGLLQASANKTLAIAAPTTPGQSITYLVEAAFSEVDSLPIALQYYNSALPSSPYSGPANSGAQQNTLRAGTINLVAKAGVSAATGTQVPPAVDSGFVPLYYVTVAYGASSVINSNITVATGAPFIPSGLAAMMPLAGGTFIGPAYGQTPAQFDASTKLATTAFVQRALGNCSGALLIGVNTTLTSAQIGSFVELSGGAITVTLPSPTAQAGGQFVFWNNNSAANVTLATPSGSFFGGVGTGTASYVLAPEECLILVSDGFNWCANFSSLRGLTPATSDNSTKLATTAFVKAQGETFNGSGIGFSTNTTLTVAQLGGWGGLNSAGVTVTLPLLSATSAGQTFTLKGGTYGGTIAGSGTDQIHNTVDLSAGTYTLAVGEIITVASNGPGGAWYCVSNSCAPVRQLQGSFAALKIATQGVSNFTSVITANAVVLTNSAGLAFVAGSVNVSPAINASGANGLDTGTLAASTWYYVWVIYNPTTATTAGLFSLSSTSPTLPSGYTFAARVGAVRTDSSGSKYLLQTLQYGRKVKYVLTAGSNVIALPVMISGVQGAVATPTWAAAAVANFVPPTACVIDVVLKNQSSDSMAAPSNGYGAYNATTNPPPLCMGIGTSNESIMGSMMLESTNIYYASDGGLNSLAAGGWEDNL